MKVTHTFRFLAVFGALLMVSAQPVLADRGHRGPSSRAAVRAHVQQRVNARRQIANRIDRQVNRTVNRTINRAIRNQNRARYQASRLPYYSAAPIGVGIAAPVFLGSDPTGRINNALARGLISPQEADSLMQQYHDSIYNDQRDGTGAHMANYDFVLNNLINLRAGSLGR